MLGTSRTFRPAAHAKNRRGIKQPSLRMQGDNYLDTHRNHALQSHLIAYSVSCTSRKAPLPATGTAFESTLTQFKDDSTYKDCQALARRISENREIAGLHFGYETEASEKLAPTVFSRLLDVQSFRDMLTASRLEFNADNQENKPISVTSAWAVQKAKWDKLLA